VSCFPTLTRPGLVTALVVGVVSASLIGAPSAFGTSQTARASFQGLGQMPGVVIQPGSCGTQAFGISGDGNVIVGAGCVPSPSGGFEDQAFRWTVTGGYEPLGDLGGGSSDAYAASFDGSVVVGESPPPGATFGSFRWTATQGMASVPVGCCLQAVTDDGSTVSGGNTWWKTSGRTGTFGSCGDAQISLDMVDLSANGSVAAGSGPHGTPFMGDFFHAYRSTPTGNCRDIDSGGNRNSDAGGVSADGKVIVGEMQIGGPYLAFRWTASTGMVNLGDLGGGLSRADATNGDGSVVVGHSLTTGSTGSDHAFIWTAHCGMLDLQTVLKNQGAQIPRGWILEIATDVSEDGTVITGYGTSPPVQGSKFGQTEPWRAVLPAPC
jgi:probable HAF family extracellular repeat protein